jgi:hypothetical protein
MPGFHLHRHILLPPLLSLLLPLLPLLLLLLLYADWLLGDGLCLHEGN